MALSNLRKQFKQLLTTKEGRDYLMSSHFWGPAANWGIPLAAFNDMFVDAKFISGNMTTALIMYSGVFMRFALRVEPRNLLLFACHVTNFTFQNIQMMRFIQYKLNEDVNE